MATQKIFDFHFHLLFKHILMKGVPLNKDIKVKGIGAVLNELSGGAFDSQSSPNLLSQSQVYVGVASLLAVEHAFANKILEVMGVSFRFLLGNLDNDMFDEIKNSKRIHYEEFKRQLDFYIASAPTLAAAPFNIQYLQRSDAQWKNKSADDIVKILSAGTKRFLALSIEGGHNLSNVHIKSDTERSRNPELQLKEIQDRTDADFMSLNLCHLSFIPEQNLSGFSQGLNKSAQSFFQSDDFNPASGLGITELGKQVIRQALTHQTKPILIDVKHMSVYSRFQYYKYRDKLINENAAVKRLPIISSHTGFTFIGMKEYVAKKLFLANEYSEGRKKLYQITPENRIIGETNDKHNKDLFANPWSIGLFDEEITEIMMSKGMIGISMDQRVLGTEKMVDGKRGKYYELENVADGEWKKLFIDGVFPTAEEGLFHNLFGLSPAPERHIMLFCLHLVHAVNIGNETLGWVQGTSPWDHLCIGSDYDGLINPLNNYENVTHLHKIADDLFQYLPIADKYISSGSGKALKYNPDGSVDKPYLDKVIDDILFNNGVKFTARYLRNWN
jgi:microsomal dipeptidase-like Zn-dependent dipeptidase